LFTAVCELIVGRVTTRTGLVSVSPTTIWRLRQAIDEAVGREGVGDALIETGAGSEYRLAIAVRDIVLDPSFAELPASGLISEAALTTMVRCCRRL
jgi:hypothetical protein